MAEDKVEESTAVEEPVDEYEDTLHVLEEALSEENL